jgi:uncharacterized membrane protein YeaQ/YmgE (transglycosylase-associated protein family)
MHILWTIIIGFIVGLLARFVLPGQDAYGFIMTTLLGIGGALLGQFLGQALGFYAPGEPAGWIMSVLGAVVLLLIGRAFRRRAPVL